MNFRFISSFTIRVNMMVTGKDVISDSRLIFTVFSSTLEKFGSVNTFWNCLKPLQSLPQIPRAILKSLNAIAIPGMGI